MKFVFSSIQRAEPTSDKSREDKNLEQHPREGDDDKQAEMPLLESVPKTKIKQPKKKKMSCCKEKSAAEDYEGGGDSSMFDVTLDQLTELMGNKGEDLLEKLNSSEYNGIKGLLEKLKVDGNKGLDSNNEEDLEQRRAAYGRNEIPPKPMTTFLRFCWDAFHEDMLLIILLICAVVSIGLSFYRPPQEAGETNLDWIEGVAILVAVLVVVLVTAVNDWRKQRQFRGLESKIEKDQETTVIRDGHVQQIPIADLVVGDLCYIKYGDILPADGLIVQSSDLQVDESSLTGETELIKKSKKEDIGLFSKTQVMEGSGRMLVTGVGPNSQNGKIMSLINEEDDDKKKKKGDKKKDGKKDGKKKDGKKDDKKKNKQSKFKSSTKVSPDTSKPDDSEDNTQTVHTENETKGHPPVRKSPPMKKQNTDEHEMKSTKKENSQQQKSPGSNESNTNEPKKKSTDNEQQKKKTGSNENVDTKPDNQNDEQKKKKSTKTPANDQQKKKKSSSDESSDDEQEKKLKKDDEQSKKSTKTPTSDEQKKKKSTKTPAEDQQKKKKSSSDESSDDEQEKKLKKDEEQSKKLTKTPTNDGQKKKSRKPSADEQQKPKKSSSDESSDDEQERKPNKDEEQSKKLTKTPTNDGQKKKSRKPSADDQQKPKKSSSDESSDDEQEKKPNKDEEQKKKSTKTPTNDEQKKKKSSSGESSDDEQEKKLKKDEEQSKKLTKTPINDEQKSKKSSSNESIEKKFEDQNVEKKKKSTKPSTDDQQKKKKSSSGESSDDEQEKKPNKDQEQKKKSTKTAINDEKSKKKSSSGESSDNEQEKKSNKDEEKQKKLTKAKSKNESSDEEQEKKSEAKKQKSSNDRPTTTSSVEPKVSDGDKKKNKDEKDSEKKPGGLAAMAAQAADDDGDGEDGGKKKSKKKGGKHKSVLQSKLTQLALYIGYIGMTAAVLTLICLIIRFCITTYVIQKQPATASDVSYFISFLIQAITVVVVAVPEGLPLAVALALAYAVRKMMTDNNLVKYLDACETMGNASTICSDKTGTLTTNRMTVVQCYFNGKFYDKLPKSEEMNKDLLPDLFEAITVNSNYTSKIEKSKDDEGLPKQVGNKTECALLDLILKWDGNYDEIREQIPQDNLVKVYTFNSARKMMSTVIERDDGYRVYTKGASEMVLKKCKQIIGEDNQPKDLSDHEKKKIIHDVIEKMANEGLRAICIAYRDLGKEKQNWDDDEKITTDLICIGIVGIEDPVRDEVPEAVQKCQKAGIVVRMVTGDNVMTARSIATKCGIIKPDDDFLVLEGKEFNKRIRDSSGEVSQKKLDEVWPKLRVLARSLPIDKYNLVNGIVESHATENREVVAVTGDGTNDGPALKRADVGFAMGIQGTDVAKDASDIILTDDNFASIVKAVMWGRNVYDCIAKFLQFQLTANLSAGVLSVVSSAAISTVPLRAVQMLWVNLVMDSLASLALATEPPTEELLNRKPYGRTKSIISPLMLRNIIGQSIYQLVLMFVILYVGQNFLGFDSTVQKIQNDPHIAKELSEQFTMVFNAFVLMTLFNEINSRKLHGERNVFKGIFRNPMFYGIWLGCFAAQILIVTFGGKVFSCARLDIKQWAWCLFFGLGSLIWQQILLFIPLEPFEKCFSAVYRCCCPCLYKNKTKEEDDKKGDEQEESDEKKPRKKRSSKSKKGDSDAESDSDNVPFHKYPTIGQLTNATVVTVPPPAFARFMLRRSVDRLNSQFEVINAFRSRLELVPEKRNDGHASRHKIQENDLEE